MGCDIHAFIEHREPRERPYWDGFGEEYHLPRWYQMFGYLAGVRGDGPAVVQPRGVPPDMDYRTKDAYWGDNWWKEGATPDPEGDGWHTASWLSGAEWEQAMQCLRNDGLGLGAELEAFSAILRTFANAGEDVRVVFWFDN